MKLLREAIEWFGQVRKEGDFLAHVEARKELENELAKVEALVETVQAALLSWNDVDEFVMSSYSGRSIAHDMRLLDEALVAVTITEAPPPIRQGPSLVD